MIKRSLFALLLLTSAAHADDFDDTIDPTMIDTSGMGKPKSSDPKTTGVPPLLISRTLGIHSGYFPVPGNMSYSTRVSASLTNDISDVISFGFDRLDKAFKPDKFLSRFIIANVYYYLTMPIHVVNDVTRYQWATASRMAAAGLEPHFIDLGIGNEKSINHGKNIWALWSAPFRAWKDDSFSRAISLKRYAPRVVPHANPLFNSNQITAGTFSDTNKGLSKDVFKDELRSVTGPEYDDLNKLPLESKWEIVTLAAGYNDQSNRARELQDKSYWQEAHYMDGAHYLRARFFLPLSGLFDSLTRGAKRQNPGSEDMNITLLGEAYKTQKVDLSSSKIALLSTLSILCSGSFYRTFRHTNWEYYDQGTQYYRAYEWYGFRIPDVLPYLNSGGMSYHVTTGYRISPTLAIPVTFEYQFIGESAVEGTIGISKRFPEWLNLDLHANVLISQEGFGGDIKASITPWGSVSVEGGFAYYNGKTMEGERRILSLEKDENGYELYAKISLVY